MVVRGRVTDVDGRPIDGALLDVWQANDDGFYDVQQKGVQPDMNLRGIFTTGADGRYSFRSAKPRYYPIPDDGPVGKMLAAVGRHPTARFMSTSSSVRKVSSRSSPTTSSLAILIWRPTPCSACAGI